MPPVFTITVAILTGAFRRAHAARCVRMRATPPPMPQPPPRPRVPLLVVPSMTAAEAFRTLAIAPGSSHADIRAAYLRAAQWCHPDKNPGNLVAEEVFKRVSEAYLLLHR